MSDDLLRRAAIHKQRLQKKVVKLIKQRDHWKEQYDHLRHMLKVYPYMQNDFDRYERDIQKRKEHDMLAKRVKEQELLIRVLLNDETVRVYEIQEAYRAIIAEKNQQMNEEMKKARDEGTI